MNADSGNPTPVLLLADAKKHWTVNSPRGQVRDTNTPRSRPRNGQGSPVRPPSAILAATTVTAAGGDCARETGWRVTGTSGRETHASPRATAPASHITCHPRPQLTGQYD